MATSGSTTRRSAFKNLAIVCGSIALATYTFNRAQGGDVTTELSPVQLASMGMAGLQPIPDAVGNQVGGDRSA